MTTIPEYAKGGAVSGDILVPAPDSGKEVVPMRMPSAEELATVGMVDEAEFAKFLEECERRAQDGN